MAQLPSSNSNPQMSSPRQGGRGITEQDVWTAADALLMAGQRPTIERIRQQLGRGSPNTVSPYLDAWFAGLGARLQGMGCAARGGATLPDGAAMPEPVARAALDLWTLALHEGHKALEAQAAAQRAELDARGAELAAQREALEQARAVLHERVTSAETAAADARQARDDAQADAVASRQALAAARDAAQAAQEAHAKHRAQWDAERAKLVERADASERRWMLELDAARESVKSLQQERRQLQRELQETQAGLAAMTEAQHEMRSAKALQDAVIARLREQVSAQEALAATYQSMLASPAAAAAGRNMAVSRKRRVGSAGPGAASILRKARRI
ncbi:DNA-binding protein [Pandoraea nosoerga]|uniref:DNA-binding protein n=1 Tax=Pandoraea nosoerga TaxID=2508296 RepID=UPI0030B8979D